MGVVSAISGIFTGNAKEKAAKNSANIVLDQYKQTRSDLSPFRDAGASAVGQLSSFFDGSNPTGELTALENTPGYQFALTQGLKSVQNGYAARGLGSSGAALKGAAQYATGLAQQTYGANLLNPLEYLGTLGEGATSATGTFGANASTNAANALAAGTVGQANDIANGFNQANNNTALPYFLSKLF